VVYLFASPLVALQHGGDVSEMRIGLAVAQYGRPYARRDAVIEVARGAEELGIDGLWAGDRILDPVIPRDPYPGAADGRMPIEYRTFLDALTTLTLAAAVTERVRLGTCALNAPLHSPVLLARSLTTLDVLSEGRLDVGLGIGWSSDEYEAAGVPWQGRGKRLEEIINVLERIWTSDPVDYLGECFSVPLSHIRPKSIQHPRPPIYLGGFAPVALDRVGRRADGWLAPGAPRQFVAPMWDTVRRAAERAGRDPSALRMIIRINPKLTDHPSDKVPMVGTLDQIARYALEAAKTGAYEILVDLQQTTTTTDQLLHLASRFTAAVRGG
jgi:probable F420-dependent oxidoreductase